MNEDLLTTNNINNADLNTFSQIKNRSSNVYDNNKPEFLKDRNNIIQNETINDTSIGYDQFKKFEMESSKKKKKIQKTTISIDSRNRKNTYSFTETFIKLSEKSPFKIIFYRGLDKFYLITENTYVSDIKNFKEIILYNLPAIFSDKIGVNNDLFEFNKDNGSPIIYVNAFYLNNKNMGDIGFLSPIDTSNIKNFYDRNLKKYEFNIIELKLPSNINKDEIFDLSYSNEVKASFISSVQISYNTPSHYKVTLNRTFSNIFAAKLVSSEIPNTAFSFNGVEINTNIGKNKLKTKVNNRLRWINESDSYKFSTYTISDYKLYANANPYYNDLSNETLIQNQQNEINKRNFNRNVHSAKIKTYCYENISITSSGGQSYIWSPALGLNTTQTASVIANPITTTSHFVELIHTKTVFI